MNDHTTITPDARRKAIESVLTLADRRTAMVRERDEFNRIARGGGSPANQLGLTPDMQDHARAEADRLTREIGKIPNIGRAVRRSLARQIAPAKVRPVYPLPEPVVVERKATWNQREEARRRRQMAKGWVLSA